MHRTSIQNKSWRLFHQNDPTHTFQSCQKHIYSAARQPLACLCNSAESVITKSFKPYFNGSDVSADSIFVGHVLCMSNPEIDFPRSLCKMALSRPRLSSLCVLALKTKNWEKVMTCLLAISGLYPLLKWFTVTVIWFLVLYSTVEASYRIQAYCLIYIHCILPTILYKCGKGMCMYTVQTGLNYNFCD